MLIDFDRLRKFADYASSSGIFVLLESQSVYVLLFAFSQETVALVVSAA